VYGILYFHKISTTKIFLFSKLKVKFECAVVLFSKFEIFAPKIGLFHKISIQRWVDEFFSKLAKKKLGNFLFIT